MCRRRRRYLRASAGKSSKSGTFLMGKIIPEAASRIRNDGNGRPAFAVFTSNENRRNAMYIGLGGLLILILILWLLGVI
jgi:hypothetical protein